jgi:thiol-disulfide isomerase/thioredoxin
MFSLFWIGYLAGQAQVKVYGTLSGEMRDSSSYHMLFAALKQQTEKSSDQTYIKYEVPYQYREDTINYYYSFVSVSKEEAKAGLGFEEEKALAQFLGRKFPLDDLQSLADQESGKPIWINLWYTGCAPCIKEIPELNKLKSKYGKAVDFLAITFDEQDKVEKFLEKYPFEFQQITGQKAFLEDALKISSYPKNLLLDHKGNLAFFFGGIPMTYDPKTRKIIVNEYPEIYRIIENLVDESLAIQE